VSPGEELWVKIIDIDLQRRRISLSIKQAAEGGEVSEEYREAFGEHAYDDEGNYIGTFDYGEGGEFTPETEAQAAWADYAAQTGGAQGTAEETRAESEAETVEAEGPETVEAEGPETVEAEGPETVEAEGPETVEAEGPGAVEAEGEATS
jgi:small subunit ribosomal protein S1